MGTLLIFLILVLCISVFPVMIAAKFVKSPKTGFGPAVFAVLFFFCISVVCETFIPNEGLASLASMLLGTFMLAAVLDISLFKAVIVALMILAIQLVVSFVLLGGILGSIVATS